MFCEKCGTPAAEDATFCERCGARVTETTAVLPPTTVAPPSAEHSGAASGRPAAAANHARRRVPRRRIVIGSAVAVAIAGGAAGVYLGVLKSTPVPATASLPALPANDLVQVSADSPLSSLGKLPGSVVVATGGHADATTATDAPYLILTTRADLKVVCGQIDRLWLSRLHDDGYVEDPGRAEALGGFLRRGECAYGETLAADGANGTTRTYTADVFARRLSADDARLRRAAMQGGALDGLGAAPARAFRGPYTEVQIALTMPDKLRVAGALTADGAPSDKEVVRRIATIVAYSARGRDASAHGNFVAAASNRQRTEARVEALIADVSTTRSHDVGVALTRLRTAARASLGAVRAYQACGGVACADRENRAATAAKRRFVAVFNPLAERYLHRAYVETDL